MQDKLASDDVGQYAFLASSKRAAWSFARALVSAFVVSRAVSTGTQGTTSEVLVVSVGLLARPAQIAGTARLRHATVTTQNMSPKVNPSSTRG